MDELSNSGERFVTTQTSHIMIEHLHRYVLASAYVKDKIILDIASGEGYGSNMLAETAKHVFGVDISQEAVAHAQNKYRRENLNFRLGSASAIPLKDNEADIIVSFETIEHHDEHEKMMLECKRVLKPNGLMIISSPDKKYYSDIPGYKNPFHIKELYIHEFKDLLLKHFTNVKLLNQKYFSASVILSSDAVGSYPEYSGTYGNIKIENDFTPVYNIAFVSDGDLPIVSHSFFLDLQSQVDPKKEIEERYTNSTTWKIGKLVLSPVIFIKNLFSK